MLSIENSGDDAVPQPHVRRFHEAAGSTDKRYEVMKGANHYYSGQPEQCVTCVELIFGWLEERALVD